MQLLVKEPTNELHPIAVKQEVWYLVGMDVMDSFKKTTKGSQTMTCYFSKWVEAFAVPDKTANSVAQAIYTSYCRHGAPNSII